ncbi:MAG: hypothetical protein M3227_03755 [Thermoproteota archaeon]|nr:hypothetical protein [Thermoproteota archaeon]
MGHSLIYSIIIVHNNYFCKDAFSAGHKIWPTTSRNVHSDSTFRRIITSKRPAILEAEIITKRKQSVARI